MHTCTHTPPLAIDFDMIILVLEVYVKHWKPNQRPLKEFTFSALQTPHLRENFNYALHFMIRKTIETMPPSIKMH